MKNKIKLFLAIIIFLGISGMAEITQAAGVLRVSPTNPRYFTDNSGRAIYLTGSHTWSSLQDIGQSDPPLAFDYSGYLDFLQSHGHNFMRIWRWELTKYQYGTGPISYSPTQPWPRTGPGNALDGKLKFNLNQFDQSFFDRLRARVIAARDRGIYVSVMFFDGHAVQLSATSWAWKGHPFNINNNINSINGNPNGDSRGTEIHTLDVPAVTNIQEAYIRKVVDTVNDLDNVLYEISNETGPYSTDWQYQMVNYVKSYEAGKPKQHPVGMTYQYSGGDNAELYSSPADWISPSQFSTSPGTEDYKNNPPVNSRGKVMLLDTDHIWGMGGDRIWVWKSFARGQNTIFMDDLVSATFNGYDAESARDAMGHTLSYANRMNLASMLPSANSTDCYTTYCLRNPGQEYLVYQPGTGNFTVNVAAGDYDYEWFNPVSGAVAGTGSLTASGGSRTFAPPFSGQAVLYLSRVFDTTAPLSPSVLSVL